MPNTIRQRSIIHIVNHRTHTPGPFIGWTFDARRMTVTSRSRRVVTSWILTGHREETVLGQRAVRRGACGLVYVSSDTRLRKLPDRLRRARDGGGQRDTR